MSFYADINEKTKIIGQLVCEVGSVSAQLSFRDLFVLWILGWKRKDKTTLWRNCRFGMAGKEESVLDSCLRDYQQTKYYSKVSH